MSPKIKQRKNTIRPVYPHMTKVDKDRTRINVIADHQQKEHCTDLRCDPEVDDEWVMSIWKMC